MTDGTITTQWGSKARSFAAYSPEERKRLLKWCADLIEDIRRDTGIACFLSYGALLGAVRSGHLIEHDFDIDLSFFTDSDDESAIADNARRLTQYLIDHGLEVVVTSNGQLKAIYRDRTGVLKVEFFASWRSGENFYLYFAVRGNAICDSILPLSHIIVDGIKIVSPGNPEKLLEAIYGEDWRTPNPNFKYQSLNRNGRHVFNALRADG